MTEEYKSGVVALIGRPNVGKSTLLNQLIGTKVSIVSSKPQTTRNQVRGILTCPEGQAIFLDTPGVHKSTSKLGARLVKTALNSLRGVDLIFFIVNPCRESTSNDKFIMRRLEKVTAPIFIVLNKVDLVSHEQLITVIKEYRDLFAFKEFIPVSALKGKNVARLTELMWSYLPAGPQYYLPDQKYDSPEYFLVEEIIREKVLNLTREEIPHSVAVKVINFEPRENSDVIEISVVLYIERESQKGILIGKKGLLLKLIGQRARRDIENLLGNRVYLQLWVKVAKDWRNAENLLQQFGYTDS